MRRSPTASPTGGQLAWWRPAANADEARTAARRQARAVISVDVGEQRVAILEDDRVAEVYLERPERRSIAGNIYLGQVDNVLPGMEAAFVEIGLEKNGFLYVDEIVGPELEGRKGARKIQDLIKRGQTIMVQAVKDPMKSKGARLTTEISLPGRFLVYVPNGEGSGVSRRLEDAERTRLKEIVKNLDPKGGGIIVRTAAEGASAEDIERDLVFLQRLWKTIQTKTKSTSAPALVYEEAEFPLRIVRDLFAGDFVGAQIDDDRTHRRIVSYLKKTSPHMVERVHRYREKAPLFESSGVDAEIRSTLDRRVDLPSGGYLVFDYAEAFTVIDVNTGRFVGSRGKSAQGRLEDTIVKNNLEAVKEVVHQLRLRDIGGIIVIDFIDMANPKNRETVEEALRIGARTRPDEDLRRRDLTARARGDDPAERHRRPARDPYESLPRLRGRRNRGLGGDACPRDRAQAPSDREGLARPGVQGRGSPARALASRRRGRRPARGPRGRRTEAVLPRASERERSRSPRPLRGRGTGKARNDAPDGSGGGRWHDRAEARRGRPPRPDCRRRQARRRLRGRRRRRVEAGRQEGEGEHRARARRRGVCERSPTSAATVVSPITFEAEAEKPTRASRSKKELEVVDAPLELAEALDEELEDDAESEAPSEVEPAVDGQPKKKRTRRGTRGGRGRKKPAGAAATADDEPEASGGRGRWSAGTQDPRAASRSRGCPRRGRGRQGSGRGGRSGGGGRGLPKPAPTGSPSASAHAADPAAARSVASLRPRAIPSLWRSKRWRARQLPRSTSRCRSGSRTSAPRGAPSRYHAPAFAGLAARADLRNS